MFKKLSEKEMEQLEKLLDRAVYHKQFHVGATIGSVISDDGDTDVPDGLTSFSTADDISGTVGFNGEDVGVNLSYDGLKWLWARVQGARGGKKRTLTSEQARAMAAKRHGKK